MIYEYTKTCKLFYLYLCRQKVKYVINVYSKDECLICLNDENDKIATGCGHILCKPCSDKLI